MMSSVGWCNDDQLARLQFGTAVGEKGREVEGFQIVEPPIDDETAMAEMQAGMARLMEGYMQHLQETALPSGYGYPVNMDLDFSPIAHLLNLSLENVGDPFMGAERSEAAALDTGAHSRQFEVAVLDWFARLWELQEDQYWGYVTSGGSEGNLYGLLVGRELFPNGIMYTSHASHYSVFKAAKMYRVECIRIDTLVSGEMSCADLKSKLLQNTKSPAIINVNIGTTFKGGIDDLDQIIKTLEECGFQNRYYIHCDAALSGIMLPFMNQAAIKLSFKRPIGSICISGHKFMGCPMPCGVVITRMEHAQALDQYLESSRDDAAIVSSRNGHAPIFLWCTLSKKGRRGISGEVQTCLRNARRLELLLRQIGVGASRNALSTTVVFERPKDETFVRSWQLACEGNLAHVVVMSHVTAEKIAGFVEELAERRRGWYRDDGFSSGIPCLAADIGQENCRCDLHKQIDE